MADADQPAGEPPEEGDLPPPEHLEHLPPRPSDDHPQLRDAWLRLLRSRQRLRIEREFEIVPSFQIPQPDLLSLARGTTRIQSSGNWSGAQIVAHDADQFVLMFGEWTVPHLNLPPEPDQRIDAGRYGCSVWIGLDGTRRYLDSSLPQIGTQTFLDVDATGTVTGQDVRGFFQWWSKFEPNPGSQIFRISNFPIDPGQRVMAMLWVEGPQRVVAALRTFGPNGHLFVRGFDAPDVTLEDGTITKPSVTGATAEWIVERPLALDQPPHGDKVLEAFPDYQHVHFSHCVTGTARHPGLPTGVRKLESPRLLRMYEVPPNDPSRTRMISHAVKAGIGKAEVLYGSLQ